MQTRSRVTTILTVALAGVIMAALATGQDNSAKSRQPAQPTLSVTRSASCLVRITVDPAIVLLDPGTVQGLLRSSGVAGKAAREVLHLGSREIPSEDLIEMEWLNESSARRSPTTTYTNDNVDLYDEQRQRELENIYGAEYAEQMGMRDSKGRAKQGPPAGGIVDSTGRYGMSPTRTPPAPPSPSMISAGQSITIKLSVRLPDSMPLPPAAEEFLAAIVENLRDTLLHAHDRYAAQLQEMAGQVQHEYEYRAGTDVLGGETDAVNIIKEQLNKTVDLAAWTPETPMAEAVEILRKSVEPPLNIVVLWNHLPVATNGTTPVRIDGMPSVKLGTALDLVVRGISPMHGEVIWTIKGDAIVIATAAALGESGGSAGPANVEMDARSLANQRNGLTNQLQNLELSLAGQEARRKAISMQIAQTRAEAQQRLAEDDVTRELESLVRLSEENLSNLRKQADVGRASGTDLAQATESLARARIELAKRREELSKQVGGGQLEQLNSELSRMAIDGAEKEAQRAVLDRQLNQVLQQLAQASTFEPEAARARLARETLDILANRIAELQTRIANLQPPMVMVIGAN